MNSHTAVLWIRDGVLVDRMHINPVAFAISAYFFSEPETRAKETILERLINFGFEKSGVSCADKLRMYNREREDIVTDVEAAASYYNALASEAASSTDYFAGTIDLLRDLQCAGFENFITSAVEQEVLDAWSRGEQGMKIAPYLKEILGRRPNFSKGRDHFDYVSRILDNHKTYYVADAPAEIKAGREFSHDYNIVPIGFANVITVDRVLEAMSLVLEATRTCKNTALNPIDVHEIQIDRKRIALPDKEAIEVSLKDAGAESVIGGDRDHMMDNLRRYFGV